MSHSTTKTLAARAEVIARAMDDEGWTFARIGRIRGLTPQRVFQLTKKH
jgi:hypothetical protein